MNKIVKCWDLDKTITNVWWHTDAILTQVFSEFWLDYSNYLSDFRSPRLEWRPIKERLVLLLWKEKWNIFFERFKKLKSSNQTPPPLFPWIKDVLESVGWWVNILVTNKEWVFARQDIWLNQIEWLFKRAITSDDVWWDESRLKPSPELIDIWVSWLNPDTIIMIWDTANDINAILSSKSWKNRIWILAWWWNTPKTLDEQIRMIKWKEWTDYIYIPTITEVQTFISNI